jgi:hypothetical protein
MIASSDEIFFAICSSFESDEKPLDEVTDFRGRLATGIAFGDAETLRERIDMIRAGCDAHAGDSAHELQGAESVEGADTAPGRAAIEHGGERPPEPKQSLNGGLRGFDIGDTRTGRDKTEMRCYHRGLRGRNVNACGVDQNEVATLLLERGKAGWNLLCLQGCYFGSRGFPAFEPSSGRPLRIEIEERDLEPPLLSRDSDRHRERAFAGAAFLSDERDNPHGARLLLA